MNAREQGFALLCSHLGDPHRKCLTAAQMRTLAKRVSLMQTPKQDRELALADLKALGYDAAFAQQILYLLSQTQELAWYLQKAKKEGCIPVMRLSEEYPDLLRKRLGSDAPAFLWTRGDTALLSASAVSLVGSRNLRVQNEDFAKQVGMQAAKQGYVLISGNARGADIASQESALAHGGKVISIVADSLLDHPERENVLYISEDSFDMAFSSARALSRNRIIHALGQKVFVAQSTYQSGGTWDGTAKNLAKGISPVFCYADGSEAAQALCRMGAVPIGENALGDLAVLQPNEYKLF